MKKAWPIVNLICTVITLIGIYLITSGATGLESVEEVSEASANLNLTSPAPFAYSIWGLIYLGFLLVGIHAVIPKHDVDRRFNNVRWLITVSVIFNLLWILLDGLGYFILPYILQWIMMVVALRILFLLNADPKIFRSRYENVLFQTFVLYAGWLTVALVPYSTDILIQAGFTGDPMSREFWAILMYIVATAIILLACRAHRFAAYVLPLAWALFGISIKFSGIVSIVSGILSALVILFFIWAISKGTRQA